MSTAVTAYQLLHQPSCDAEGLAAYLREVGYERLVLSSDAGHPDSPPPPEAFALLVERWRRPSSIGPRCWQPCPRS